MFLSGSLFPQQLEHHPHQSYLSSHDASRTSMTTQSSGSGGFFFANADLLSSRRGKQQKDEQQEKQKPQSNNKSRTPSSSATPLSETAAANIARKNRVTKHSSSDEHLPNGGDGPLEFDEEAEEFFVPLSPPSHAPSNKPKGKNKPATTAPKRRSIYEGMLGEKLYAWGVDVNINGKETPFLYEGDTSKLLENKKVLALYFSASWCGPCRQFTPKLVNFYQEMLSRYGPDMFEIVFISRDQNLNDLLAYYQKMPWLAVTAENVDKVTELLAPRYQLQGIPHLVILDGVDASVYTLDGRGKVLEDPYGLEFPWRPRTLWNMFVPRSIRSLIQENVLNMKLKMKRVVKNFAQKLMPKFIWRRLFA
jgi:nucleoredoxin